ncbi:MAG: GldG family protein [Polyangiaceae bacterium]
MGVKGKKSSVKEGAKPRKPAPTSDTAAPRESAARESAARESAPRPAKRAVRPGNPSDLGSKIATTLSLVSVIVLAVVLNIYSNRHYKRWDFTKGGQFTLSNGTVETLKSLDQPIQLFVLVSRQTPLGVSLDETLQGYVEKTKLLEVEFVDPDRDQARLLEIQKKYGLVAGERGGRIVTDAAVIVVAGDRHQFILYEDLHKVEDSADMRVRPQLEYALTSAIRHVRSVDAKRLCFTSGHGEPPLDVGGSDGLAELRDRLVKNNYEVVAVWGSTAESARDPLEGCDVLVMGTPRAPVPPEHVEIMKHFVESGGNALFVVGPIPNQGQTDWVELGVDELLALAGVAIQKDFVFETDPTMRPTRGSGEAFFAKAQPHEITERLLAEEQAGVSPLLVFASSMQDLGSAIKVEPLLVTSPKSVGIVDYWSRDESMASMKPNARDHAGPFPVAIAAQRPPGPGGEKGARLVVISAGNPLFGANWRSPDYHGNALLVEGAFTWLAGHEPFLDLPDKPIKQVGLRITDEAMQSTFRYVVIVIPAAVTVVGIVIYFTRRRRKERRGDGAAAAPGGAA